jgi:hypothetical protein
MIRETDSKMDLQNLMWAICENDIYYYCYCYHSVLLTVQLTSAAE